jgi:hypothetical protein
MVSTIILRAERTARWICSGFSRLTRSHNALIAPYPTEEAVVRMPGSSETEVPNEQGQTM